MIEIANQNRIAPASQSQIAEWLALFIDKDQITELRCLPRSGGSSSDLSVAGGFFDGEHLDEMAREAWHFSNTGDYSIYFTPNPLRPEILDRRPNKVLVRKPKGGFAHDGDVLRRRWFFVDVDPLRPVDASATDDEKFNALAVAMHVRDDLRDVCGWGMPIAVDSGNGWHLYYAVNDADAADCDKAHLLLQMLAHLHNIDAVKVDVTVGNLARIMKVPGTVANKGVNTEDRPHRLSSVINRASTEGTVMMPPTFDEAIERLRLKYNDRFADFKQAPAHQAGAKSPSNNGTPSSHRNGRSTPRNTSRGSTAYGLAALDDECGRLANAVPGGRNAALNQATFAVYQLVAGGELDEHEASTALRAAAELCGLNESEITKTMRSAAEAGRREPRKASVNDGRHGDDTECPEIPTEAFGGEPTGRSLPARKTPKTRARIITGFDEFAVNTQAIAALSTHTDTFVRGGMLAFVAWQDCRQLVNNAVNIPAGTKISIMQKPTLRERLTVVADWREERSSETGTYLVQTRPPEWCVSGVLARGSWPDVRVLSAIAEFPVMLPNGAILTGRGYDESSGLYAAPTVPCHVDCPDSPTHEDAVRSLAALAEAVCDFPFVAPHHRSAWLAGVLTPLARFAFAGPSPMFLVEANVPGTGKGLLVNTANIIVRGASGATLEFSRDGEELQKVLTALLIQGETIGWFDNIEGNLGGGVLNKLLTSEVWEGRILGQSETKKVPNLTTWWGTGNNIAVLGDTARRVCSIRLESPHENPESRTDLRHPDLGRWVVENRPRLLSAALTILRAYHVAGRPTQTMRPWGSYQQWSELVRGAIIWSGWPDPFADGASSRQEDDPVRGAMVVLLDEWHVIDRQNEGLTSARVIDAIRQLSTGGESLKEALEILAPENSRSRPSALGHRFREYCNRQINGRSLKKRLQRGLIYWSVQGFGGGESAALPSDLGAGVEIDWNSLPS